MNRGVAVSVLVLGVAALAGCSSSNADSVGVEPSATPASASGGWTALCDRYCDRLESVLGTEINTGFDCTGLGRPPTSEAACLTDVVTILYSIEDQVPATDNSAILASIDAARNATADYTAESCFSRTSSIPSACGLIGAQIELAGQAVLIRMRTLSD